MAIVATGYISALTAATATAAAQNARTAVECAIARRAARARATTAAMTCARWSARALRRPRRPFTPAARRHHRHRRSRPRATRRAASCTALPFCRSRATSLSRSGRQSAAWTRAAAAAAISHPHYRRLHRHLLWPTPWQSAHGGTVQAARPTYWCVWTAIDATGTMRGLDAAIATAAARSAPAGATWRESSTPPPPGVRRVATRGASLPSVGAGRRTSGYGWRGALGLAWHASHRSKPMTCTLLYQRCEGEAEAEEAEGGRGGRGG